MTRVGKEGATDPCDEGAVFANLDEIPEKVRPSWLAGWS